MTKKHADAIAASVAAKAAAEKESTDLKRQLAELQASSTKNIADLQAQLKKSNEEASALTKKHAEVTTAKVRRESGEQIGISSVHSSHPPYHLLAFSPP